MPIRRRLVEENLRFRRIKYAQELARYLELKKEWDLEQSKRATLDEARRLVSSSKELVEKDDGAPKRPLFKTVLPTDEMITLIDKGISLAAEEKKSKLINALEAASGPP